jgi:nucleoside-diphosphate-sugar epimerase
MNYLITGGTGFIGSYISKMLLEEGHRVVCFDYLPNANSIQQVLTESELENVKIVRGDIRNPLQLIHACQDEKIEIIIHEAGLLQADSDLHVPDTVDINIRGTVNVYEAARICGIKRVVVGSSSSAIGDPTGFYHATLLPNDVPHHPISLYGQCKDTNEFIGNFYNEKYGMEIVALRYVVLYGNARMRGASNWVNDLFVNSALGDSVEIPFGDGEQNMLYIKDAARATVLASQAKNLTQNAYTITGETKTMVEMRDYILSLFPGAKIKLLPGKVGMPMNFNASAAQKDLGYKAEYDIERGSKEILNIVLKQRGMPEIA